MNRLVLARLAAVHAHAKKLNAQCASMPFPPVNHADGVKLLAKLPVPAYTPISPAYQATSARSQNVMSPSESPHRPAAVQGADDTMPGGAGRGAGPGSPNQMSAAFDSCEKLVAVTYILAFSRILSAERSRLLRFLVARSMNHAFDEFRLEDIAERHRVGTALFVPLVVERLRPRVGLTECLLTVVLRGFEERPQVQ